MPSTALVLEKIPLLGRTLARVVSCGGASARVAMDAGTAAELLQQDAFDIVCLGEASMAELLPSLDLVGGSQVLVWYGDRIESLLEALKDSPRANHLFGLRYPNAPPRAWELVSVLRRHSEGLLPSPRDYLSWGGSLFERMLTDSADRDTLVEDVESFASGIVGARQAASLSEVAHELVMNAMYDAPVDANGNAVFAHDRTAQVSLPEGCRPTFTYGCDGGRLVMSVADPFGRLRREHVFGGLYRALTAKTLDSSGGGAGLGLMMIYRASALLFFDVIPGKLTRVTSVLELDIPARELRNLPRSIHFFQQEPDSHGAV